MCGTLAWCTDKMLKNAREVIIYIFSTSCWYYCLSFLEKPPSILRLFYFPNDLVHQKKQPLLPFPRRAAAHRTKSSFRAHPFFSKRILLIYYAKNGALRANQHEKERRFFMKAETFHCGGAALMYSSPSLLKASAHTHTGA